MKKVGIYVEPEFEKKLRSFLSYDFFNIKTLKKNIDLNVVIIDIKTENLDKKLIEYYNQNIPVILLIGKEDSINMRKYFINRTITDYILRDNFNQLNESICFHGKCKPEFSNIFLKDCSRAGIIKIEDIEYISYSSRSRETEFHLKGNKIFCVKKKFCEIEKIQEKIQNFLKLERGIIINISLVSFLNYKEEKVFFKNGGFIHLNKLKLKKIEEHLKYKESCNFFL